MKNNRKTSSWAAICYTLSNILGQGLTLVSVVIFTRLMNLYDYGIYNTYISWIPVVTLLIGFSSGSILRVVYFEKPYKKEEYVSGLVGLGSIVTCFYVVLIFFLMKIFLYEEYVWILILGILNSFCCFITDIAAKVYMLEFSYKKGTILQVAVGILPLLISIVLVCIFKEKQYYGRILGNVAGYVLIIIPIIYGFLLKSRRIINVEIWKDSVKYSAPLILHGMANNILAQSDRTMISVYASPSETGIYSVAYSFSVILIGINSALENLWIPWFTEKMRNKSYAIINSMTQKYIWFDTGLACIMLLCMPDILVLFSGKEYWGAITYLAPLLIASYFIFLYTLIVDLEYLLKETKIIAANTIIAGIINIFLNFIFIPRYGAIAAAYTTLISYIVSFILHYTFTHKKEKNIFSAKYFIFPIICTVCIGGLTNFFASNFVIRWGLAVVIFGTALFALKKLKDY